jgi:rhomboid protease GluP
MSDQEVPAGSTTDSTTMESFIPTSSRRQAMDWSLVLISQGIEPTIARTEAGWGLVIAAGDRDRASQSIAQYRYENRGWTWHRHFEWPPVSFHLGVLVWCAVLVVIHGLASRVGSRLGDVGVMDGLAVQNGAWWRLFTAISLHADIAHLAANLAMGFCLIGLAMGRFGPGVSLLASCLAGAGGNLLGLIIRSEPYRGLGASGMVMGALGLLATQSLAIHRTRPGPLRYAVTGLAAGVMLFILLGLDPRSDIAAHVGGLIFGLVIGSVLALVPHRYLQSSRVNWLCGAALLALFVATWFLALR